MVTFSETQVLIAASSAIIGIVTLYFNWKHQKRTDLEADYKRVKEERDSLLIEKERLETLVKSHENLLKAQYKEKEEKDKRIEYLEGILF